MHAAAAVMGFLGLTAVPLSGQAAPTAPAAPTEIAAAAPEFTLAAGGCGRGWHRQRWRDRYGRWHVRCVRNYY
jgi:hypothetical protein